ncbi:MAG: hypothetical protein M3Z64_02875 [Verrucomicrobiota bacterium]|nr:hypothetical protein [Verrucomicrobiota bacterium]
MTLSLPTVTESRRLPSPAPAPQALAWHDGTLWMGSRDLRRVYAIEPTAWKVTKEIDAPGVPWAAVAVGDSLRFTIGEGADDDRYIHRFDSSAGFSPNGRIACPELTGSYLSYDGEHLYLSQWYKHRVLQLGCTGEILRVIDVGAEICGHAFVDGALYVLRGTEEDGESWRIARCDPRREAAPFQDVAAVPFACRSLTHDGERFWTNHRAADAIVSFVLPA